MVTSLLGRRNPSECAAFLARYEHRRRIERECRLRYKTFPAVTRPEDGTSKRPDGKENPGNEGSSIHMPALFQG
jgi:hypothetical protein